MASVEVVEVDGAGGSTSAAQAEPSQAFPTIPPTVFPTSAPDRFPDPFSDPDPSHPTKK